jgi:conjugal transfer pilus assembly protein TraD
MIKSFDWREVHEGPMAAGWGLCLLTNLWLAFMSDLPSSPFLVIAAISLFMFVSRLMEAWRLWNRKLSLLGKTLEFVPPKLLANKMKEGAKTKDGVINYENVWLGWGYEWKIEHSQSVYDFKGIEISDFMPPVWFQKLYGKLFDAAQQSDLGAAWVHGLEPKEKPIFVPVNYLQGHTLILGVTGAGKTRLFDLLIMQSVLRGDTVIVIDPKGDKDMRQKTENACKIA